MTEQFSQRSFEIGAALSLASRNYNDVPVLLEAWRLHLADTDEQIKTDVILYLMCALAAQTVMAGGSR